MVTFRACSAAVLPLAGEAEVIRGFAADVLVAKVVVETLSVGKGSSALLPSAREGVRGRGLSTRRRSRSLSWKVVRLGLGLWL